MTKLDLLNSFLSERLTAALNEIIYTVSTTMKEYEEETTRIRKENDLLKEMLRVLGVTEADYSDVMVFSLPSGQQDCNSSLEQDQRPQESQNDPQRLKEENYSIKTEPPSDPTDAEADSEVETKTRHTYPTQPDCIVEPFQCTSPLKAPADDQEMIDCEFHAEIKEESVDRDLYSDSTGDTDSTDRADSGERSRSPQRWDMNLEKSDQNKVQQLASQRPCAIKGAHSAASDSQNGPEEFQAAIRFSDRFICNNKQRCASKQCEMQRTLPKSSPAWKYFSLKEGDCSKAVCLICKAVISRGIKEYTTSALLRHLRGKHGIC